MALPLTSAPLQELWAELAILSASYRSGAPLPYAERIAAPASGGPDMLLRLLPDALAALTLVAGGVALTAIASLL